MKEKLKENDIEIDWKRFTDHTLKRFLRARGGDVEKAYVMFTNHLVILSAERYSRLTLLFRNGGNNTRSMISSKTARRITKTSKS